MKVERLMKIFQNRRMWAWPYIAFMLMLVVLPLVMVLLYAFDIINGDFTFKNFLLFFSQSEAVNTFIYSIGVAFITTIICLLLAYPAAYFMAMSSFRTPAVMAILFILPMWINFLLRTIATVELFGLVGIPLGEGALLFGMVYDFLPFMIYPIYNTLQKMDVSLIEAAKDLGANKSQVFFKVVVPLSLPGVYSGIVMVFMPTVSTFAIAELLTHNKIKLFGSLIQESINSGVMLGYGAALSLIMLVIIGLTSFIGGDDNAEDINR